MSSIALVQGGTSLYTVDLSTGTATALSLPSGVVLSTTKKPRFATLNQWTAMVNSPSNNLAIDPEGTVRPLTLRPPANGPSVAAGGGTGLTGVYLYRVTFIILDSDGNLLSESPFSPPSISVTFTNQNASITDLPLSLDTVTGRRIYRTLSGGSLYFHLMDVLDNTAVALIENVADATVTLLPAAPTALSMPPGALPGVRFKNIVQWKSRLWAIADDPAFVDTVYFSETNQVYTFPNTIVTFPTGQYSQGVVAFAPRRNQLGLLKPNGLWQIGGTSSTTGISPTNITVSQIAVDKAGCVAPDSVVVVNDRAFWLAKDGVYEWSDQGVVNITNPTVAPWFKTDTYFNRSRFPNAFAKYNELRNTYELHVAALGSSVEDRWVAYNLDTGRWYGPHKTDLFTPSHAAHIQDSNGLPMVLVGSSAGVLYSGNSILHRDGAATAIDFDCHSPNFAVDAPDIEHAWLEMSVLTKIEPAGTLVITPLIGRLDATGGAQINVDLTKGRQRLRRLGTGPMVKLRFQHTDLNQSVTIYGFEIPFFEIGRR
jgi:hypothetical protein